MQQKYLFDADHLVNQSVTYWTGNPMGLDLILRVSEPDFCSNDDSSSTAPPPITTSFPLIGEVSARTYPGSGLENGGFSNTTQLYGTLTMPTQTGLHVGALTTTITYDVQTSCQPKNHSLSPEYHHYEVEVSFIHSLLPGPTKILERSLPGASLEVNVSYKHPSNSSSSDPDFSATMFLSMNAQNVLHLDPKNHTNLTWTPFQDRNLGFPGMSLGNQNQSGVLESFGDWFMEDWGFLWIHPTTGQEFSEGFHREITLRQLFCQKGGITNWPDPSDPSTVEEFQTNATDPNPPAIAVMVILQPTGEEKKKETPAASGSARGAAVSGGRQLSGSMIVGYWQVGYQKYYGKEMLGYWQYHLDPQKHSPSNPASFTEVLAFMDKNQKEIASEARSFEQQLYEDLLDRYGKQYADVTVMAYRQTFAAIENTVSKPDDFSEIKEWSFLKEISPGGDVNTMDVLFPASPALLHTSPDTLARLLKPILAFANNETDIPYTDGWCPHQLGFYPVDNSTTKQQEPMPLEETGNMFLMLYGIVLYGSNTSQFPSSSTYNPNFWLKYYEPLLKPWAHWMVDTQLPIPPLQLCTDDFTGPLYGNANLAAKGIIALQAFRHLCDVAEGSNNSTTNTTTQCDYWSDVAAKFASQWVDMAIVSCTVDRIPGRQFNHTILAFNNSEFNETSWSLKYNMIWQKLLKFPDGAPFVNYDHLMDQDVNFYRFFSEAYGYPLDARFPFQKVDWFTWGATMQSSETTFLELFGQIYDMFTHTDEHVPLTDLYFVQNGGLFPPRGFRARPVIGALFAPMLLDKEFL